MAAFGQKQTLDESLVKFIFEVLDCLGKVFEHVGQQHCDQDENAYKFPMHRVTPM